MPLTIIADIHALPERAEFVETELLKLMAPTRAEPGCLQYDLHRDRADPAHFCFYETWESRELWQRHMNGPGLIGYSKATEGAIERFVLNELLKIA